MYEAFYGLNAKPFQLNPDPFFFFASRGHTRAMSYLEYGLHQGEGFIIITGDVGAGKTTLVRNLFRKLEGQNVIAAQLVSTQLDADDLLRMVAAAFGLPAENATKATLLKRLETFLVESSQKGKRALLLVDEAQNLTPRAVEELRMLSNFQMGEKSLLQSFLLGQPEFRLTMQSEDMQQLRQRVIASYHLGPMEEEETRAYITHRLETAGWGGDPAFTEPAFAAIHAFTGGVPRRINTLCDRLLLLGFLEELHEIDEGLVQQVVEELQTETGGIVPTQPAAPVAAVEQSQILTVLENQLEVENRLAKFEQRLAHAERSLIGALKLMRDVVATASARPAAAPAADRQEPANRTRSN